MKIVGISGRLHSGKDTLARHLIAHFTQAGVKAIRISSADKLKEFTAAALGWGNNVFSDARKDLTFESAWTTHVMGWQTPRDALKAFGKAGRDVFGEDFWIERAIVAGVCAKVQVLIVADVRYWNELTYIQNLGWAGREQGKARSSILIRTNRADRLHKHNFVTGGTSGNDEDKCAYLIEPGDAHDSAHGLPSLYCNLSRSAHPSHYSNDTSISETELPDSGSCYDLVLEESSPDVAGQRAVEFVQKWGW